MKSNPFLVSGYISPEYFCDREAETSMMLDAITGHRHLTIFSSRRIGKTGLIKHVFHTGSKKKYFVPVYTDILSTSSLREFTESFGKALLSALAKNEPAIRKILKSLISLRPKFSIDPVTGEPTVSLTISNDREAADSLDTLFRYLREQKKHFVIAIDEFQQVADYPEKNVEAVLRTHIQETSNATIIFSGSRKHILTGIFSTPDRPFYNSTQLMEIGKIPVDKYREFIAGKFEAGSVRFDTGSIDYILEITSAHTFYVQFLCNRLFSVSSKITRELVKKMLISIISENEPVYASYITLLTPFQFRILRAVALNNGIMNPTSSEFISGYELGAASSVSLAVKSLTDKEFLTVTENKYVLNDIFLNLWLKYKSDSF